MDNKSKIINRIFLSRTDKSDENKDSEKRLNRKNIAEILVAEGKICRTKI